MKPDEETSVQSASEETPCLPAGVSTDEELDEAETGTRKDSQESTRDVASSFFRALSFSLRQDSFLEDVRATSKDSMTAYSSTASLASYGSLEGGSYKTIRFQVIIWYVGRPDEVLGKVEMKVRVTIFWNATDEKDAQIGYGMNNPFHKKVWKMHGRQRAYQSTISEVGENDHIVYVPPVSILNAADYEILGEPEVCRLNTKENLMKWSCLYKASLLQDDMQVAEFPHDSHDLVIRLGILKHRQPRKRWDKNRWKLALATADDCQENVRAPYGTIVDHVKVPGFSYRSKELQYEFMPLASGLDGGGHINGRDQCLQVKLRVKRESSYYDRNIIPLLAALNTVAVSTLALHPNKFGARGQMILATSFVEIGIRMTVDSHLPVVGYQIKIQWVLNNFFFGLLFLVITSSIAYVAQAHGLEEEAKDVDRFAAIAELVHMLVVLIVYCIGSGNAVDRLCRGAVGDTLRYE